MREIRLPVKHPKNVFEKTRLFASEFLCSFENIIGRYEDTTLIAYAGLIIATTGVLISFFTIPTVVLFLLFISPFLRILYHSFHDALFNYREATTKGKWVASIW